MDEVLIPRSRVQGLLTKMTAKFNSRLDSLAQDLTSRAELGGNDGVGNPNNTIAVANGPSVSPHNGVKMLSVRNEIESFRTSFLTEWQGELEALFALQPPLLVAEDQQGEEVDQLQIQNQQAAGAAAEPAPVLAVPEPEPLPEFVPARQYHYKWEDAKPHGSKILVLYPTAAELESLLPFISSSSSSSSFNSKARALEREKNFAAMLQYVDELGAYNQGAFKIHIPEQVRPRLPRPSTAASSTNREVTQFAATKLQLVGRDGRGQDSIRTDDDDDDLEPHDFWRLKQTNKAMILRAQCGPDGEPTPGTVVLQSMEGHLLEPHQEEESLPGVMYCQDQEADRPRDRRRQGLPRTSPIHPLPGDKLEHTRRAMDGVHNPTSFEGTPGAPFGWHHEHAGLSALNYLWMGSKNWKVIAPSQRDEASAVFRQLPVPDPLRHRPRSTCDMFVAHEGVFGGVAVLGSRGVVVRSFDQQAGQIVFVFGKAYHSGYSRTHTIADARNYADDSWDHAQAGYCDDRCSDVPVTREALRPLRAGEMQLPPAGLQGSEPSNQSLQGSRTRRKLPVGAAGMNPVPQQDEKDDGDEDEVEDEVEDEGREVLGTVEKKKKRRMKHSSSKTNEKKKSKGKADMDKLVDGIVGIEAIRGFLSLVRGWRAYDVPIKQRFQQILEGGRNNSNSLASLWNLSRSLGSRTAVSRFTKDLVDRQFAHMVYVFARQDPNVPGPACPQKMGRLMAELGLEANQENRKRFQARLENPRVMNRLLDGHDGLQCFLPYEARSPSSLSLPALEDYRLTIPDIGELHRRLDDIEHCRDILLPAGKAFLECVWRDAEFPKQAWEWQDWDRVVAMGHTEILTLLARGEGEGPA